MNQKEKLIRILSENPAGVAKGELARRVGSTKDGLRSVISQVRKMGYAIYANEQGFDAQGRQRQTRYRMGNPTKAMVAFYYENVGAPRGRVA